MNKLFRKAMDPISSETHFIGACLSLIGLLIMIFIGIQKETSPSILWAAIVFGLSLIALYSASSIYHYFSGSDKVKTMLRKLDHSMIYVLIVGTYTPVVMSCMPVPHAYYFLAILWSVAILGIVLKICWLNAPRAIATAIYLILGWSIVFDFQSFQCITMPCFMLIACGGIAYSIGAFIYIFKKPNFTKDFGFHELFHIFVIMGSVFHYLAIVIFIL
ncbi:hemolysin III family protein [Allocoprobacillus halotolerans]|uniref:Hemolysin III family protein n=1 Tax=Allocoprobacillus halotolerans TaxID=2944914 RepID=A0ABY5I265_9FIRM|nr:hemolysin III family protein [Allocoprobacillus halotolerans]UTY38808.1 hemolysin III family protein [Allocoprobacillus halotolerans]